MIQKFSSDFSHYLNWFFIPVESKIRSQEKLKLLSGITSCLEYVINFRIKYVDIFVTKQPISNIKKLLVPWEI